MRTTLIVGFPGETDEHYQHLQEFLQRHEFDHVGVFTFSAEDGTAAATLPHHLPPAIMDERRDGIMAIQQPISLRRNQGEIGKIVDVLIEQEHPGSGLLVGRSARFAPEVDGLVYLSGSARLGSIVPATIHEADHYDLHGEIVDR